MIKDEIRKTVCVTTKETTLGNLNFNFFRCTNFNMELDYNKMRSVRNQPAKLYGTVKTHKYDNINNVTSKSITFRLFHITYITSVKLYISTSLKFTTIKR